MTRNRGHKSWATDLNKSALSGSSDKAMLPISPIDRILSKFIEELSPGHDNTARALGEEITFARCLAGSRLLGEERNLLVGSAVSRNFAILAALLFTKIRPQPTRRSLQTSADTRVDGTWTVFFGVLTRPRTKVALRQSAGSSPFRSNSTFSNDGDSKRASACNISISSNNSCANASIASRSPSAPERIHCGKSTKITVPPGRAREADFTIQGRYSFKYQGGSVSTTSKVFSNCEVTVESTFLCT